MSEGVTLQQAISWKRKVEAGSPEMASLQRRAAKALRDDKAGLIDLSSEVRNILQWIVIWRPPEATSDVDDFSP